MRIESVDQITVRMPLVGPFTTSFGTQVERQPLLIRVTATDGGRTVTGWGECVTLEDPVYSAEYTAGAQVIMRDYLVPLLYRWQDERGAITAETVQPALESIVGHPMAKAAIEMAVLDAQLRLADTSFADYLGVTRTEVPSGVSVGIFGTIPELLDAVQSYVDEGYARIKLKIKPGWDVEPVAAVRERFGDIPLQVDANTAYTLADASSLARLDAFDLLLIEQPLAEDDLRQHALLAERISTPVCLDESIVSARCAADAIALRAASVINIKPGRVGGYLEAKRIHDLAQANGIAVWCGGMLETGIGRRANAALAGLSGFTLPGDISASDRFYSRDITEPVTMTNGAVRVPTGPGFGAEPLPEALAEMHLRTESMPAQH